MKKLVLILAAAVTLLIACGESGPTSGTVVQKIHEPERHWTSYIRIQVSETCTTTKIGDTAYRNCIPFYINVPYTFTDDEDWVLILEDDSGRRGHVKISEVDWDRVTVGSWWDTPGVNDPTMREKT